MASKRDYKVKGTKDFMVLSGIFFFLCLWAVKDAWYPSPKVLEKHPQEVRVSFANAGWVEEILVEPGSKVVPPNTELSQKATLLARLKISDLQAQRDKIVAEYKAVKADPAQKEKAAALLEQRHKIDAQLELRELKTPKMGVEKSGIIEKILVPKYERVEAGEAVVLIKPESHFYLFNKSLAIFSFIAFWVFLGLHVLAR